MTTSSAKLDDRILHAKVAGRDFEHAMVDQILSGRDVRGSYTTSAVRAGLRGESRFYTDVLTPTDDANLCYVWNNKSKPQIRVGGAHEPKIYIARAMSLPHHARLFPNLTADELLVLDASHCCDNNRCIRRSHIVMEPNFVNTTRRCCFMFGCPKSPSFNALYVCPHQPYPCLLHAHE